jgi:prophage antirepressor-like protein
MTHQIIAFKAEGNEFPMEIIDQNGDKWVTRKQLEVALGVERLEPLHRRLGERGELKEGIHYSKFRVESTRNPQGGNPNIIIYSYRGIIRVAMASEGTRAVAFRDWAEDVLYEVMVKGSYSRADYSYTKELNRKAKAIRSELKAFKEDEKMRKQAEAQARMIMRGIKSLDDLNEYPAMKEAAEKAIENIQGSFSPDDMDTVQRYWFERLNDGEKYDFWEKWVESSELYEDYRNMCAEIGHDVFIKEKGVFFKELKKISPVVRKSKFKIWGYLIPGLQKCRQFFEKALSLKIFS